MCNDWKELLNYVLLQLLTFFLTQGFLFKLNYIFIWRSVCKPPKTGIVVSNTELHVSVLCPLLNVYCSKISFKADYNLLFTFFIYGLLTRLLRLSLTVQNQSTFIFMFAPQCCLILLPQQLSFDTPPKFGNLKEQSLIL